MERKVFFIIFTRFSVFKDCFIPESEILTHQGTIEVLGGTSDSVNKN